MNLTRPQRLAFASVEPDGTTNEGLVYESGVGNPRRVMGNLVAKGLFTRGLWWGDGVGYEYELTPEGRDVASGEKESRT